MMIAPSLNYQPDNKGAKRGSIVGWSRHSRKRLRRFLLMFEPAARHYNEANITLTVPGPPLTVVEMRKLWKDFSRSYQKLGWSAVWRMEVQKRGAVHWHMVATIPSQNDSPARMPDLSLSFWTIKDLWSDSIKKLGSCTHSCKINGEQGTWVFDNRMWIPGADEFSSHVVLDVKNEGDRWAWRRYMQDHASKGKQEQIAEGFGRHWGVIGRKGYKVNVPKVQKLSDQEYFRFVRWMQRLCSGTVRADLAPFGRKRGKRQHRGTRGTSVWFSNPYTASRLIDLAQELSSPG